MTKSEIIRIKLVFIEKNPVDEARDDDAFDRMIATFEKSGLRINY